MNKVGDFPRGMRSEDEVKASQKLVADARKAVAKKYPKLGAVEGVSYLTTLGAGRFLALAKFESKAEEKPAKKPAKKSTKKPAKKEKANA